MDAHLYSLNLSASNRAAPMSARWLDPPLIGASHVCRTSLIAMSCRQKKLQVRRHRRCSGIVCRAWSSCQVEGAASIAMQKAGMGMPGVRGVEGVGIRDWGG